MEDASNVVKMEADVSVNKVPKKKSSKKQLRAFIARKKIGKTSVSFG